MSPDATQMRDELGGWSPSIMSIYTCGYLILDEAPPTRGHEAGGVSRTLRKPDDRSVA